MNFNKDYPIAILDTNIVMDVPNILDILKGCNIVIPFTLIEELDNHKKENKGARDFVNNFLALSEKANLSKDGYKLENDCMLYLDIDKNNSYHKDINLDSKKQDIKFIAEAKNLKEKYNDMEVVLISSDKIMKITASIFDVKVKFLEEFITEYLKEEFKLNILFNLLVESKDYYDKYTEIVEYRVAKYIEINSEENYYRVREIIFKIVSDNKDINGLYKFAENSNLRHSYKITIYEVILQILSDNKDIDGLYKLSESYNNQEVYKEICNIEVYKEICNILVENKDIGGLYKLASKNLPIREIKGKYLYTIKSGNIYMLGYIYNKIFDILVENKDIGGLYELERSASRESLPDLSKKIDYKIRELENNK